MIYLFCSNYFFNSSSYNYNSIQLNRVLNEERVGDVKCEGTLRAIFGISDTRNAAHGSGIWNMPYLFLADLISLNITLVISFDVSNALDSPESAAREVAFFYPAFNLPAWRAAVEPLFVRALESTSTTKKAAESGEETRSGEALEFLSPTQRTPLGFHRLRSSPLREHSSTP